MSYPEATYLGDRGEVSATYRPANQAPELMYPNGNTGHYLATGASTRGLFGLYRWVMVQSRASGPHFHRSLAESFYVLTARFGSTTDPLIDSEPATSCTSRSRDPCSGTNPASRPRC